MTDTDTCPMLKAKSRDNAHMIPARPVYLFANGGLAAGGISEARWGHEMRPPNPVSFVYLIACGPAIKIGVATNVEARLSELQCGNPHQLTIIDRHLGGTEDEASWHRTFRSRRIRGEWFDDADGRIRTAFRYVGHATFGKAAGRLLARQRVCEAVAASRIGVRAWWCHSWSSAMLDAPAKAHLLYDEKPRTGAFESICGRLRARPARPNTAVPADQYRCRSCFDGWTGTVHNRSLKAAAILGDRIGRLVAMGQESARESLVEVRR